MRSIATFYAEWTQFKPTKIRTSHFGSLNLSLRPILLYPHPNLRRVASPIESFTNDVKELAEDLLETMYAAKGLGLSAPQINVPRRLITLDVSPNQSDPLVLVNPVVRNASDPKTHEEGCLSFPGFYEKVKRSHAIEVEAVDQRGRAMQFSAEGLKAICIQHECDHLDGKLFVDHLSKLKASRIHKKMLQSKSK